MQEMQTGCKLISGKALEDIVWAAATKAAEEKITSDNSQSTPLNELPKGTVLAFTAGDFMEFSCLCGNCHKHINIKIKV